ncbi:60S acidic ribosomal protein P1-like [Phacochoerus africanus]|uniref:60S acidic ribosomal protein P1-like n=1 Tax=Phacochoerus africanus TaxID=41426 RepID=UPI001FDA285D|nr:60S acidic ribosomal protein P1-like [Phacochoerus africanus]
MHLENAQDCQHSSTPCPHPAQQEVTVTENKINALIKAAGINVDPFWQGWLQRLCPRSTLGASSAMWGLVDLPQQLVLHHQEALPPATTATPAEEKKVEAKKEESEESDDDTDFGLFD